MAVDHLRLRLVFVEDKATARTDLDHQRTRLWAWSYWCLVAATFALLVFLGFLA